jgi:hypothetical protein
MSRVARDLGYTLAELAAKATPEELSIWGLIYQYEYQEQEKAMKKARRR